MKDWYVGQKVVCIIEVGKRWSHQVYYKDIVAPVSNGIYTIRAVEMDFEWVGLLFEEIRNRQHRFRGGVAEPTWRDLFFKPLEEKKTDISTFKKLLTPAPKEYIKVPLKKVKEYADN
jgi:hypothetical protein